MITIGTYALVILAGLLAEILKWITKEDEYEVRAYIAFSFGLMVAIGVALMTIAINGFTVIQ